MSKIFMDPTKPLPNDVFINEEIKNMHTKFETFHKSILDGDFDKTAQFYAIYIQFIKYFLMLECSVRLNDIYLLQYALSEINCIYFALNHQNYARLSLWYENNLRNVENTHPSLRDSLIIGVKRTVKAFSRAPVDLTIEQTINAEASRR